MPSHLLLLYILVCLQAVQEAAVLEVTDCPAPGRSRFHASARAARDKALLLAAHAGHVNSIHQICECATSHASAPDAQAEATVIEIRNGMLRTPLHVASHKGHSAAAAALLSWRADLTARDGGSQTPLHCAVQRGHLAIVDLLLEAGASVLDQDNRGRMPLHLVAYWGHDEVLETLSLHGGHHEDLEGWMDHPDHGGQAPLQLAARQGHVAVVTRLLEHGADATILDTLNRSALHNAVTARRTAVVHELLKGRAAVNAQDHFGRTALHEAVQSGSIEAADLLLVYGAEAGISDKSQVTPRMLAESLRHHQLMHTLDLSWSSSCPPASQFTRLVKKFFGRELPPHLSGCVLTTNSRMERL